MIKILVVSDTHYTDRISELPDLSLYMKDVDAVFALGDFTSFDVLEYLNSFKKIVYAVHGNMDDNFVKNHLRDKMTLNIENVSLALTHGSGSPYGIEERIKSAFSRNFDAYIFGHTHQPMSKYTDGVLFFNPGSLAIQTPSLGVLYVEKENIWGKIVYV
ncbi:MAG: metallophosphoesterase [Caldisericaceae bacterium]